MATARQICTELDIVCSHVQRALRLHDCAKKYERLARLHGVEAACWQSLVETSQSRVTWLAAMAAEERARGLRRYWLRRAQTAGQTTAEVVAA
ncbi:MAG: hypothetical protein ACRET2_17865 [Steroidobacteraceae bacterium]